MDVEVIEFIVPTSNRKNLFVSNIPALDEDHIYATLYDAFSVHGLVYEIQVFPPTKETGNSSTNSSRQTSCYAFVKFYSYRSSTSARKALDGKLCIGGAVCKVAFAKRRNTDKLITTLYLSKCYELAAYYLGFNSWSSKITKMEEDRDCPRADDGQLDLEKVKFVCCVKLELAEQSLSCTGVGVWEETYVKDNSSLGSIMAKVRKIAHARAMEDVFSKLVIISLSNGKTSVEVNTTRVEQVLAENQVDDNDLLQVNELEGVPGDQDDVTAVDIDDANLQLLQELEDSL